MNNHLNSALKLMVVLLVVGGILMVLITKRATERKMQNLEQVLQDK